MTPLSRILERLPSAREGRNDWSALCPAHDDRNPSLSIKEGDDGRALLHCHAGCKTEDVLRHLGLEMRDIMPADALPVRPNTARLQSPKKARRGTRHSSLADACAAVEKRQGLSSRTWFYHDAGGEPVGAVLRFDGANGKTYRPVSLHDGGWYEQAMEEPRPLYGVPSLKDAGTVVVVEGEKAADAATLLGYVATTSSGGAMAVDKSDWSPLAGKDVVILPDNDDAGSNYADDVTDCLLALSPPACVRIVELDGLEEGGDLADMTEGASAERLAEVRAEVDEAISRATPVGPPEAEDSIARYEPFPADALPEPLRCFVVAGAQTIGCDEAYLALPALAVCGAAIGNSRRLEAKAGWPVPPVIWAAVIGESGSAKSPAMRLTLAPTKTRDDELFREYEQKSAEYEKQLAVYERDMMTFRKSREGGEPPEKPQPPRQGRSVLSDVTLEALASRLACNPRGLLLAVDELAGWLQGLERYSNGKSHGDAARYLSLYGADTLTVDRKTGVPPTIRIQRALVCVAGGIQPAILRRCFTQEHRESGLLARFLLACPPRRKKVWSETTIPSDVAEAYESIVLRLFGLLPDPFCGEGECIPDTVRLSAAAKHMYQGYYNLHNDELRDLSGDLASAWSKLEETPLRLALLFHCVRSVSGDGVENESVVDEQTMAMAIRLTEWFKRETRRVYAMFHESDADRDRRKLVEWIERRDGAVTARQMQQGLRQFRNDALGARQALDGLVAAGYGVWETAGRKTQFVLSPTRPPAQPPSVESVDVDTDRDAETDWGAI